MKFDRKKFFEGYRREFGPVQQYQVEGLERLLDGYEAYWGWWNNIYKIANSLAQVKHETAGSFMPVVEGYYLASGVPKDKDYFQGNYERVRNFQKTLRYFPYYGIGDIQLTWRENYVEQDAMIRKYFPEIVADFESRTGKEFNLVKNPDQMLDGQISFAAMTIGMNKGTFTGKSFSDYIRGGKPDYFNMRSIVNGDKNYRRKGASKTIGQEIAADSLTFEKILRAAQIPDEEVIKAVKNFPVETVAQIYQTGTSYDIPAAETSQENPSSSSLEIAKTEAPPPEQPQTQIAEQIVNVGSNDAPPKPPTTETVQAPPPTGTMKKALAWLAGFGLIPPSAATVIETIKSYAADGSINWREIAAGVSVVGKFIFPYLVYIGLAFLIFWAVKEIFKQITLLFQIWAAASVNKNNVQVVPTEKRDDLKITPQ